MSNVSIAGYAGWPAYDTFLIVSLSSRPIYDPNPLRPNPNPKKPVLSSCRVHGLGRTLTPLEMIYIYIYIYIYIQSLHQSSLASVFIMPHNMPSHLVCVCQLILLSIGPSAFFGTIYGFHCTFNQKFSTSAKYADPKQTLNVTKQHPILGSSH